MFDFEKTSTEELEKKVDEVKVEEAADETTQAEKPVDETLNRDKETVPLAALMETKRLLQQEKQKRLEIERERTLERGERAKADIAKKLVDMGFSEEAAKGEADTRYRQEQRIDQLADRQLDYDIRDLAKGDSFYADAATYGDEIRGKMKEYGVSAEQAYLLVRGPARLKETQTETEQRILHKRGETEEKKVETSSATPVTSAHKLTETDRMALKGLQEHQPDAKWTVEKYWKEFYGDTVPKE